jgi:hypothetical protein
MINFGIDPRYSTSLQLVRIAEKITTNRGGKRLKVAVFLDVTKAVDSVLTNGLLYKLPLLNFPSYMVHTISSFFCGRTFGTSFQRPRLLF